MRLVAPQTFPPEGSRIARVWTIGGGNPLVFDEIGPGIITNVALEKLAELTAANQPFFFRVSYVAPHVPILTPPDFMVPPNSVALPYPSSEELASKPVFERLQLAQYATIMHLERAQLQVARGSYYGLVSFVDRQVGRIINLLEERGQLDNTLIVINSDHGLQLGEHGVYKKRNFYEQTASVPLVFSWPGHLPKGVVIDELVELIDFLPTVLDLVGLRVPEGIAGRSLVPLLRGEVTSWRPAVFSEIDHSMSVYTALRVYSGRRIMVRTEDWKMIYFRDARAPAEDGALYHLAEDPGETRNLFGDPAYREVIADLKRAVDAWDAGERFEPR